MSSGSHPESVLNVISVDVEEHFQVSGFADVVDRESWSRHESRVENNTFKLLDLFDRAGVKATFFVLGWVGERHPLMVRRIADAGHEIGCHGYSHRLIYDQTPEEFRRETERARRFLQDTTGQPVNGYRAASFSITRRNLWALDILAECGFQYDSSLFPVVHDRYGIPGALRQMHRLETPSGQRLLEVPPSTLALGRAMLPVAGGGYLRLYPLALTAWAIKRLNRVESMPAVVYIHPWEVDTEQPRIAAKPLNRFRHYNGIRRTESKLTALFRRFRFGTVAEVIAESGLERGESPLQRLAEVTG